VTIDEHIARLKLQRDATGSSMQELEDLEKLSGLSLPPSFRELWSLVGGCTIGAKIRSGPQVGQDVCEFWDAQTIVEKLTEDRLPRVVPFGEDIWGNWFFVDSSGSVKLIDWTKNRIESVSPTFEQFLDSLELPS
jgi:hypothetical protein